MLKLLAQNLVQVRENHWARQVVLALAGTALLTLSAKIQIPLWPVKVSMQSFTVIFLAAVYGRNLGAATIALYLLEGALGLPVFQGTPDRGIGFAYMMGPTAGYLLGFLASAYGVGFLSDRGWGKTVPTAFGLFVLGHILIDIPGVSWLAYLASSEVALTTYLSYQLAFALKLGLGTAVLPLFFKQIKFD